MIKPCETCGKNVKEEDQNKSAPMILCTECGEHLKKYGYVMVS